MDLKKLLKIAGVRNDIIKEVEKKVKKTSAQMEIEHQEKAMAMTKMMLNEALKGRKGLGGPKEEPPFPKKTIIVPDDF